MSFEILTSELLVEFTLRVNESPVNKLNWLKLNEYYNKIKKPGLEYEGLDYMKSLDFLLMTVQSLNEE